MKINKQKLYTLYTQKVDKISEAGDWKKPFGPKEIVDIIAKILEKNPDLTKEK